MFTNKFVNILFKINNEHEYALGTVIAKPFL